MRARIDRVKGYLWQTAVVAGVPAVLGAAILMKPAPLPDNTRPVWSDDAHLQTCPACRSGLSQSIAVPTESYDEAADVAQGKASGSSPWLRDSEAAVTRSALDG